jgi:hypothetical protein
MRRTIASVFLTLAVAASSLLATPASAARDPVSIKTSSNGDLSADGFTATVSLRVRCDPVGDVLEAFVTVSQEQTFAEAGFGPVCDGRWHEFTIGATALDVPFAAGSAQVSSLILICDAQEQCVEGQDSRTVRLG